MEFFESNCEPDRTGLNGNTVLVFFQDISVMVKQKGKFTVLIQRKVHEYIGKFCE